MDSIQIISIILFYGVVTPIIMFVSFCLGQTAGKYYKPIWKAFTIFIIGAGLFVVIFFKRAGIFDKFSLIQGLIWIIPGIVGIFLIMKGKDYLSGKGKKKKS